MPEPPGNITYADEPPRQLNENRDRTELRVINTGDHLVQVGSHYHFFEVNPVLGFDRIAAYGKRLDLPAGDRIDFPPGETLTVTLIPYGGDRRIHSFYGVVDGAIDDCNPRTALDRLRNRVHEPLAAGPEVEAGE